MPAPSVTATFTDEDGDEFPVRIFTTSTPEAASEHAWATFQAFERTGDIKPRGVVKLQGIVYA